MSSLIEKARKFITDENLMNKGGKYIVALSGGADSVCLLLCLKELGFNIEAVHCNFKLRGAESERDELFCKDLCARNKIKIHIVHFDTKSYATMHKISIEMAARELRYNYFAQLRNDIRANAICVGHHIEDTVETFILNIIRGTGIKGLTGIAAKNGYTIRPLLSITRNEIERYLEEKDEKYVTDSSNLINDVKRNKVRLDVMPALRSIDESADKSIWETSRRIHEAYKVFEEAIKKASEASSEIKEEYLYIDLAKLKKQASPEYTLYNILSKLSFTSATIDDIFSKIDTLKNSSMFSSSTHRLVADRGFLIVEPISAGPFKSIRIPECGTYVINDKQKIKLCEKEFNGENCISRNADSITIDASKIKMPLYLRRCKKGDSFMPLGMKGKKLVSDYMTDRKYNFFQKERQLLLTDSIGQTIWLVGQRLDDHVKITTNTNTILSISIISQ